MNPRNRRGSEQDGQMAWPAVIARGAADRAAA
jgi:hypothetical protein